MNGILTFLWMQMKHSGLFHQGKGSLVEGDHADVFIGRV